MSYISRLHPLITSIFLLASSCQKEFNGPSTKVVVLPVTHEVSAIVITNGLQGDYDSIVYRYLTDKTYEVHYNFSGDSTIRTYSYDAAGRLSKLEDEKAIYYTNNDIARRISFIYDNSGDIIETLTDFATVSAGIRAYYNNTISGDTKSIIIYDTAYASASYNLDWTNRIIYNTVSSDNYLLYDSCIFNNYTYGHIKTVVSAYSYDANNNATAINKFTYQDMNLAESGTTDIIRDKPAPVFEALRKELYHNLATWYQTSSAMQDNSFQLFPVPGGMYKSIDYKGHSVSGGLRLRV